VPDHSPAVVAVEAGVTVHPRPIGRLRSAGRRQALLVLGVLTVVILTDQLTKAWAWRHLPGAVLNTGSTWFLGHTISSWYRADPSGALLDLASTQILAFSLFTLLRRPRPLPVLLPAALAISGWASNLGDRLGLHLLTAPGMPRGAVDFAPLGHCVFNIADACIATGTLLLGASLCRQHHSRAAAAATRTQPWRRARRWALLAAVIPALLGTATTLTATETQPQTTGAPVIQLLTPTSATSPTTHG
jgi:lipoprotein signal peptidase